MSTEAGLTPPGESRRVVVVGGGITGLAAAHRLATAGVDVTLVESSDRLGGKILTTPFAGLAAVDEGPDAFLVRMPAASRLARDVGLGEAMTSPASGSASIWHDGLHPIPAGLMLGVPTGVATLARSRLLSWRGKARAALEPILPRRRVPDDNLGALIRSRFGDEIHEMLVDPLVGSIYASDTDRLSMSAVPQIGGLVGTGRSLLLNGRHRRASAPTAPGAPIFETPTAGLGALVTAIAAELEVHGTRVITGRKVLALAPSAEGYAVFTDDGRIDGDGVVLATPAHLTAAILADVAPEAARLLEATETSSVAMVSMAVPARPDVFVGSGYLVPKQHQRSVTAVSFASNKWRHWQPADGSVVLRTSLGRDGLIVLDRSDEELVTAAVDEVSMHLGIDLAPTAVRVSRWPDAFPQYRPQHLDRVDGIERALALAAPGVLIAGASYRGIGIPACVQQGNTAAEVLLRRLGVVGESPA